MKAKYRIHSDQGYIESTFEGSVTLPELGAHVQAAWSDPGWKPEYNGLLDFSASSIDLSENEVQDLTRSMTSDPRCSLGRFAFVVSTAADFGKLRKINSVAASKSTLRIFFDRHTAEDWLLSRGASNGSPGSKP